MDLAYKLHQAMAEQGIFIRGEIDWSSNEFQRFAIKGHSNSKKSLFVILYGNEGASFGDWRNPPSWTTVWEKSWREISNEEREIRNRKMEVFAEKKREIRIKAIQRASIMLHEIWCEDARLDQIYVKRKCIIPYYAKQIRSYLVLPIYNIESQLISLQYIKPNGWKQFKKNASPKGGMLCMFESIKKGDVIRICEGYATGAIIYEAIGAPVVVAFSASNLLEVVCALRIKYPNNEIHICGDDDIWLKDNVGRKSAILAAQKTASKVVFPQFNNLDISNKPTDFNDLFCLTGIEEVEQQLIIYSKFV